jgi:hypothetical protein
VAHDYLHRRSRARNLAPWQPLKQDDWRPPPVEEPIPLPQLLPARAPGAPRAAAGAYLPSYQSSEPPAVADLPPGWQDMPSRAPAAARAARDAYFVSAQTGAEERQPELGDGYFDETPRPKRRAAEAAYWLDNLLSGPEGMPPGEWQLATARHRASTRARERAANPSYWVATGPPLQDDAMPPGQPWVADPGRQTHARRAGGDAYHVRSWIAEQEWVPADGYPLMPERAPGPQRADPETYDIHTYAVDLIVDGAPDPGCPVRTSRQEQATARRPRTEAGDSRALRPQSEDSRRPRRDECR